MSICVGIKRQRDEEIPFEEITPEPRSEFGFSRPPPSPPEKQVSSEARSEAASALADLKCSDTSTALDALLGLASAPLSARQLKMLRPPVQAAAVKGAVPLSPLPLPSQLLSDAKPEQLCLLAAAFKLCPEPTAAQREAIASRVRLSYDSVSFWFRTRQVLEQWVAKQPAALRAARVQRLHSAHNGDETASETGSEGTANADEGTVARPPSTTPLRATTLFRAATLTPVPLDPARCLEDACEGAGAAIAEACASLGKARGRLMQSSALPLSA